MAKQTCKIVCVLHREIQVRLQGKRPQKNLLDETVTRSIACEHDNEQLRGRREG
jgi:hypothetical protein